MDNLSYREEIHKCRRGSFLLRLETKVSTLVPGDVHVRSYLKESAQSISITGEHAPEVTIYAFNGYLSYNLGASGAFPTV